MRNSNERQVRRISVGPNITVKPDGDCHLVWSPVLRKNVVLRPAEYSFLMRFSEGRSIDQIWPELMEIQTTADANTAVGAASLYVFLRIERFLLQGLLTEETIIPANQLSELYFSQHSSQLQELFDAWLKPNHAVQVKHLPYGAFLRTPEEPMAQHALCQFWEALGETIGAPERRDFKIRAEALLSLFNEYRSSDKPEQKILETPLVVCRRPDFELALLDNAELAAVAHQLGLPARAKLLQPADFLGKLVEMPSEFFGTMRGNIPYHSVFYEGEEIIHGRRPDLYERLEKISIDDLRGKAVLDLGCNIGMNCYLAVEKGARLATGIDLPELVGAATRLNSFFGSPCRFLARDLNNEITGIGNYDTVFLFALLGHLHSVEGVLSTIKSCHARVVYLETHCEIQEQGELKKFLASLMFRKIDFLGYSLDNSVCPNRTRRLYRCEVAGS